MKYIVIEPAGFEFIFDTKDEALKMVEYITLYMEEGDEIIFKVE